jgi:hypothetical protein
VVGLMNQAILFLWVCFGLLAPVARADSAPITIDFENLSDSTYVGSTYASQGIIFNGAVVLTAGISLNDLEFPPHSGTNVAFDANGPITLSFLTPISSFSAFFTYLSPVTVTGFDALNQTVATTQSLFSANNVSTGNAPNELIQLNDPSGISQVTLAGDPAGDSFVFDDVTFTQISFTTVPEPGTLTLLALSLFVMVLFHKALI